MITEIAFLNILPDSGSAFELAFEKAKKFIRNSEGYVQHELLKCIEAENKYVLIVRWRTLEDHTEGFRKGKDYAQWKALLHKFYQPFPLVEHFEMI